MGAPHPHVERMSNYPTTIERAYELAKSGDYASVSEVKAKLQAEGRHDVAGQLYGPTMTAALRKLCAEARAARAKPD